MSTNIQLGNNEREPIPTLAEFRAKREELQGLFEHVPEEVEEVGRAACKCWKCISDPLGGSLEECVKDARQLYSGSVACCALGPPPPAPTFLSGPRGSGGG